MYRLGTERGNVRRDSPETATAQRATAEQQQDSYRRNNISSISRQHDGADQVESSQCCSVPRSVLNHNRTIKEPIMSKFESKLGKRANGQEAWRALLVKYENNSAQGRCTRMNSTTPKWRTDKIQTCSSFKLNNWRMISKAWVSPFQSIE